MKRERALMYNCRVIPKDEKCEWYFLIINDNREIKNIEARILRLFQPVEPNETYEGILTRTGLKYKLINFESTRSPLIKELKGLYYKISQNPELYRRKERDGLANFLAEQLAA